MISSIKNKCFFILLLNEAQCYQTFLVLDVEDNTLNFPLEREHLGNLESPNDPVVVSSVFVKAFKLSRWTRGPGGAPEDSAQPVCVKNNLHVNEKTIKGEVM